jgi:hypothetical protein
MTPAYLVETLRGRGIQVRPGPGGKILLSSGRSSNAAATDVELAALKTHKQAVLAILLAEGAVVSSVARGHLTRLPAALRAELEPLLVEAEQRYLEGGEDAHRLVTLAWRIGLLAAESPVIVRVGGPVSPAQPRGRA